VERSGERTAATRRWWVHAAGHVGGTAMGTFGRPELGWLTGFQFGAPAAKAGRVGTGLDARTAAARRWCAGRRPVRGKRRWS
jgi:hypothetical protein